MTPSGTILAPIFAALFTRKPLTRELVTADGPDGGGGWFWPLPVISVGGHTYSPTISDGFGTAGSGKRSGKGHYGVDVMYRRRTGAADLTLHPPTDHNSRGYFIPGGTPVLAAAAGKLWSAERTSKGYAVVIDHGRDAAGRAVATFYQHLERLGLPERKGSGGGPKIEAGAVLGPAGFNPEQGQASIRHLHFALWINGSGNPASQDPAPEMDRWVMARLGR